MAQAGSSLSPLCTPLHSEQLPPPVPGAAAQMTHSTNLTAWRRSERDLLTGRPADLSHCSTHTPSAEAEQVSHLEKVCGSADRPAVSHP